MQQNSQMGATLMCAPLHLDILARTNEVGCTELMGMVGG